MESVFQGMYTFGAFLHEEESEIYAENIFPIVAIVAIFLALAFALGYYLLLNRTTAKYSQNKHWGLTLFLVAVLGFGFSLWQGNSMDDIDIDGYLVMISLINAVYAAVFFFLFSMVLKKGSINAQRVPF